MKRDMELIRKILLKVEDNIPEKRLIIDNYSLEVVGYHCYLCKQSNLLDCQFLSSAENNYNHFPPYTLTWTGHDFLDTIRDDGTWQKTVKTIAEKGLDMSIKTIGTIASAFITAATEGVVNSILKNGGEQ